MAALEASITDWIGTVTGGQVASAQQVTAGGRPGYAVDVDRDGERVELFLQKGRSGATAIESFLPVQREAEVLRALAPIGIPVPTVWGVDTELNVLLVQRLPGKTWFQPPRDPDEARSVAQDFVRDLAAWHATPAKELDLPTFGPVRTIAEHQRDQVKSIREMFDAGERVQPIDALSVLMLDILENRMPDRDGDPVLVQGDTGPGNLLYLDGKVTAVLDWELAHLGDPMDDIAWLSWRATQHSFPDFPERMREYEKASGHDVDPARVVYYRVNALARLGPFFGTADMGRGDPLRAMLRATQGADAAVDRAADGGAFVMGMLHRRMRLEAIAAAVDIELPGREVEGEDEPLEHAELFDTVLETFQTIVAETNERATAARAKGAARNVKYLKELDRNGRRFAQRELDDISALLGSSQPSLPEARRALADAAQSGTVSVDDYLLYHWRRMVHDDHLLRTASGALYERSWPPLA
jgi:aminoglycoside phosphotransferase (APT) family kinase protein